MTKAEQFCKLNGIYWKECIGGRYCDCNDHLKFDDAKSILEVMMKREDWHDFRNGIDIWRCCATATFHIDIKYILNPDKLLDEAIEFCEENKT